MPGISLSDLALHNRCWFHTSFTFSPEGVDSADWSDTYGITTDGSALHLQFVADSGNVGSRTYLLAPDEQNYYMFYLKNREFTFDVDVSQLPCGLNGALYFVEMDEDGGMSKYPTNKAGASYGTGYCDCLLYTSPSPRDLSTSRMPSSA